MKHFFLLLFISLLSSIVVAQNFRFAQITDTHIGKDKQAEIDLENVVADINNRSELKFVLVTGDIANFGDNSSLITAKRVLDKLIIPYYIIPGNHDTKWSESACTFYKKLFKDDKFNFEYNDYLFLGFNTGINLRMGDGFIKEKDIKWIKGNLEKVGKQKSIILVTHFPIMEGYVDNWYELTDAVRNYNIKLCIGGHFHKDCLFNYDRIPGILARSDRSNSRKGENANYTVYNFERDSVRVYTHMLGGCDKEWNSIFLNPRPDFSVNKKYYNVKEEWIVKDSTSIYTSPVIDKDNIYIADGEGNIKCYDILDYKLKWNSSIKESILGTPGIYNKRIVFGTTFGNIYCLNCNNGSILWKIKTDGPIAGMTTIKDGVAYIGGSDHKFRAINIMTGNLIWSYNDVNGYVETLSTVKDNKVIFGAWDNTLYALNKDDGKLCWKWNQNSSSAFLSPAVAWPIVTEGKVFISTPNRILNVIDFKTGKDIYSTKKPIVRESQGVSNDGKRIYFKEMNDSISCYSTTSKYPKKIWSINAKFGYEYNSSMLLEKDSIVYSSTRKGLIIAVEGKSGKLLWIHKVGNTIVNTVIPISKDRIAFSSVDGSYGVLYVEH